MAFTLITAFVRDALRKKVQSVLSGGLSAPEETLLMVCEFWFAVTTGTLPEQLKTNAIVQLLRAQSAFARLGAIRIASTLRAGAAQIAREHLPVSVHQTATHIENVLSRTEDPVDDLIARFAMTYLDMPSPAQTLDRQIQ